MFNTVCILDIQIISCILIYLLFSKQTGDNLLDRMCIKQYWKFDVYNQSRFFLSHGHVKLSHYFLYFVVSTSY